MSVVDEIAAERQRQVAKGWTAEHDDDHDSGDIILASWGAIERLHRATETADGVTKRALLVQSAALIVAEIERGDRAALATSGGGNG